MSYIKLIDEKIVSRLLELLSNYKGNSKSELPIVRRAEDFPFMLSQYGLVPTLTFYLSKIENNGFSVFESGLKYFSDVSVQPDERLRSDATTGDGKGYASYLSLVMVWPLGEAMGSIDELRELSGRSMVRNGKNPKNEFMNKIESIEKYGPRLELLSMPSLIELKKILKALS